AVRALGLDEGTARLLAATPTLRGAWLTGVVLVLLLAVLAATASPRASAAFLALAPVLPVAGVAYAFGPLGDPGREIAAAAPYAALRLLVVRTAVVVSSTLVPGLLLAPFLPPTSWYAVGWLLPALAMTAVALALAERVAVHLSSVALTLGWLAAVSWSAVGPRDPAVLTAAPVQLLSVAAIAACAAVLVRHHRTPAPLSSPRSSPPPTSPSPTGATARSPAWTSPPGRASPACSAPTAPARRPSCASSPPSWRPTAGAYVCSAVTRPTARSGSRSAAGGAPGRRTPGSTAGSPPSRRSTTSPFSRSTPRHGPDTTRCGGCSTTWGSATSPDARSARCPAGCAAASASRRRSSAGPSSSSSTSRRR